MPKAITSANILTRHTLRVLDLRGFEVWRNNNAAVYDPTKKVFRSNSATKGIPDIIGYQRKTGKFIAVEIKAGKDRLSEEQKTFLNKLSANSGFSFVIRSVDDIEALNKTLNLNICQ